MCNTYDSARQRRRRRGARLNLFSVKSHLYLIFEAVLRRDYSLLQCCLQNATHQPLVRLYFIVYVQKYRNTIIRLVTNLSEYKHSLDDFGTCKLLLILNLQLSNYYFYNDTPRFSTTIELAGFVKTINLCSTYSRGYRST